MLFISEVNDKKVRQMRFYTCIKIEPAVVCKDYDSQLIKILIEFNLAPEKSLRVYAGT